MTGRNPVISKAIAAQAADWIVRLSADDPAQRTAARAGFEAWKQEDERHAAAAGSLEEMLGLLREPAAAEPASTRAALRAAFPHPRKSRLTQRAASALVLACALGLPAWIALQAYPPSYLMADIRTATGERATRTLSDGTTITLGSRSAVTLHFDERRRVLELLQGEILVDVAHDGARPFVVQTSQGTIRALGTRFIVDKQRDTTTLTMLASKVEVRAAGASGQLATDTEAAVVSAGQQISLLPNGLGPLQTIDIRRIADAWVHNQLVVSDQPLARVLDELERNRPGHIFFDRARLDGIRITAVLPLDDTGRALQLLVDSVPALRVRTMTPYLVWVDTVPH